MVCVDNSEFARNGDYSPSRFQAQADAVNLLAGAKTQHHPENTVGVMAMAGKTPTVLVTPTSDLGKVLQAMQKMKIDGNVPHMSTSVQIAQLALKHRENKNQRQRIVVFIGSPVEENEEALVKIAKKLKKNNVAVDIVSFGCEEENRSKLEAFHAAVNSGENSHLVSVPSGTILSDMLFSTPIFMEEGGSDNPTAPRSNIVDGFDYGELGVDPTLDPELALALRMSVEEERARQAALQAAEQGDGQQPTDAAAPEQAAHQTAEENEGVEAMDEDTLLQQALALSMQGGVENQTNNQEEAPPLQVDDPELAMALQMSMAPSDDLNKGTETGGKDEEEEQ